MEENEALDVDDIGLDQEKEKSNEEKKDEGPEKQKYINDNVIAKGYNLDDLSRSITIHTGLTINEISLEVLKKEIEIFKNEKKKRICKS